MLPYIFLFSYVLAIKYYPNNLQYQSAYNQEQSDEKIWNQEFVKDKDYEYGDQYAVGFWTKWSQITPVLIEQQQQWHNLVRVSTLKNHQDHQSPQDRTLTIWVGQESYQFTTYSLQDKNEKYQDIKYGNLLLDSWNYIYYTYSYDQKLAKGFVYFGNGEVDQIMIPAEHEKLDYIQVTIGREFDLPIFNGFYSNIIFLIDEGYITDKNELVNKIKTSFKLNRLDYQYQLPQTVTLIDEIIQVNYDKQQFSQHKEKDINPTEYSISGWLKWEIPIEEKENHLIFRLTNYEQFSNNKQITDRIIYLTKQDETYFVESHSCIEQKCEPISWKSDLKEQQYSWHFIYLAYNKQLNKLFQFVKYEEKAFVQHKDQVNHYEVCGLFIQLQKDKYTAGYNGEMKKWKFNYGLGAYSENGFEKDTLLQQRFGLVSQVLPKQIQWKFYLDDLHLNDKPDSDFIDAELDPVEYKIQGIQEYGYGLWFRFVYDKMARIEDSIGISRLSNVKDNDEIANKGIGILLRPCQILFQTYSIVDKQIHSESISKRVDGQWLYVYTGYKRYGEHLGLVAGCVYQNEQIYECITIDNKIVHYQIDHFVKFQIGKVLNQVEFNGQIRNTRLYFGPQSFLPLFQQIKLMDIIFNNLLIFETIKQYSGDFKDEMNEQPTSIEVGDYLQIYGIELWFRQEGQTEKIIQYLYQLINENQLIMLGISLEENSNIMFHSHNYDQNDSLLQVNKLLKLEHLADKLQWTYIYYGHDLEYCFYFIQTKSINLKDQFECYHHATNILSLQKGRDLQQQYPFNGKMDYLNIHLNSNIQQFYTKSDAFINGLKLFPTAFQWTKYMKSILDIGDDIISQDFRTDSKITIDGQRTYGYGFWSRYMSKYPKTQELSDKLISIIQLITINDQSNEIELLTTLLSVNIDTYYFKGYDLNETKYKYTKINQEQLQENKWNYIYCSYSTDSQTIIAFIYFSESQKIMKINSPIIHQNAITKYVKLNIGKYTYYNSFNGQIANLILKFDGDAVIDDVNQLTPLIKQSTFSQEDEQRTILFIENTQSQPKLAKQYSFNLPQQYSIYCWFRPNEIIANSEMFDNQVIFKLHTMNNIGLSLVMTPDGYEYSTYSILKDSQPSSWIKRISLSKGFGSWTYVWMGYSRHKRQIQMVQICVDNIEISQIDNIEHYLVKSFIVQLSSKQSNVQFTGEIQQFGMDIGDKAFIQIDNQEQITQLPQVTYKQVGRVSTFRELGLLGKVNKLNHLNIMKNKDSLIGSTEYAYSLWTRWLHYYTPDFQFVSPEYNIIRFSRSKDYNDCDNKGDKILMVTLDKRGYQFQTYNREKGDECSIRKQIDYKYKLEGFWNFIYFGYRTSLGQSQAKGAVYFSMSQSFVEVEFDVEHIPLGSEGVVTVREKEFNYGQFNGLISDIKIQIGEGFVEQVGKELLTSIEKDDNSYLKHTLINREMKLDPNDLTKYSIKVNLVNQYATFGWFKQDGMLEEGQYGCLLRIRTNNNNNNNIIGDETFLILVNQQNVLFKSYTLQEYVDGEELTNKIEQIVDYLNEEVHLWVFYYMGYTQDLQRLKIYVKFQEGREFEKVFEQVSQYVPLTFHVNIGDDPQYTKFQGIMDDINIVVGESSYSDERAYDQFGQLNPKYVRTAIQQDNLLVHQQILQNQR